MSTTANTPTSYKWGISGAMTLDNDFYASDGVKTPPEAKNSVYM